MNRKITLILAALIILASVAVSWLAYPKLPDVMASHWGPGGVVDGWMNKSICVWIIPGIMLFLSLLFSIVLLIDPSKMRFEEFFSNYSTFGYFTNLFLTAFHGWIFLLFLLAVHSWMLLWNLNIQIPANTFMPISIACLIFYLGVVTTKTPHWFIGSRSPWRMFNKIYWQKTHKFCGILWRFAAIIILIGSIFPKYAAVFILAPVIGAGVITSIYLSVNLKDLKNNTGLTLQN